MTPHQPRWYGIALDLLLVGSLACVGFVAIDTKAQVTELAKRKPSASAPTATYATQSVSSESTVHRSRHPIRLSIEVAPPEAQLFLDDEPASNPLQLAYPSDDAPHAIRAEASGYVTMTVPVSFDHDVMVVLALAPESPAKATAPQ